MNPTPILDLFQYRFDTCSALIVLIVVGVLARRVINALPDHQPILRFAGIVTFLAAGGWAFTECDPTKPFELASVTLFALLTGAISTLATAAVVVPWAAAARAARNWVRARRDELERQQFLQQDEDERQRQHREHRADLARRAAADARRPPEPTPQQRLAIAQQKLDVKLGILRASGLTGVELKAAERRARQVFLNEIDGVIS